MRWTKELVAYAMPGMSENLSVEYFYLMYLFTPHVIFSKESLPSSEHVIGRVDVTHLFVVDGHIEA